MAQHQQMIEAEAAKKSAEEMKSNEKPQTAESRSRATSRRATLSPKLRIGTID